MASRSSQFYSPLSTSHLISTRWILSYWICYCGLGGRWVVFLRQCSVQLAVSSVFADAVANSVVLLSLLATRIPSLVWVERQYDYYSQSSLTLTIYLLSMSIVVSKGRTEEAWKIISDLHHDPRDSSQLFAREEFLQITTQFEADTAAYGSSNFFDLFRKPHMRQRMLIGSLIMWASQANGAIVIYSKEEKRPPLPLLLIMAKL